eukprot:CAMPEP_0176121464 /NCGR_PEP_ID=MMETSP0120_2-20121206/61140_1 /TAXON_ID=160619 /ORGANISM="Kryptoperidinium foliaceum, Strain CCMP 1326" /LENGTH=124 /DNA_ID=CAMNT_0017456013 /DNA_START=18 /DNA_END=389 /DNA_ORIENTATION=-
MMLRNIACSFTPARVKEVLEDAGFAGSFSFVYVPSVHTGRSNLGYAFVCFRTPEMAEECRRRFHGKVFGLANTKKICEVQEASVEKDLKAAARSCRRQRSGRNHGLLICDEVTTTAEADGTAAD